MKIAVIMKSAMMDTVPQRVKKTLNHRLHHHRIVTLLVIPMKTAVIMKSVTMGTVRSLCHQQQRHLLVLLVIRTMIAVKTKNAIMDTAAKVTARVVDEVTVDLDPQRVRDVALQCLNTRCRCGGEQNVIPLRTRLTVSGSEPVQHHDANGGAQRVMNVSQDTMRRDQMDSVSGMAKVEAQAIPTE